MSLAAEQQAFFDLVAEGLPQSGDRLATFAPGGGFSVEDRIALYRDMFLFRQVDALREDFPALAALLGDELFVEVAREFLRAHPSRHHSLARLGAPLPAFLAGHPLRAERPDLADLARLEWARAEAFVAPDEVPCAPDALASAGESLPDRRLLLARHLRPVRVQHDVLPLQAALRAGEAPPPPSPTEPMVLAAWRRVHAVVHARLAASEGTALIAAEGGAANAAALLPGQPGGV